MIKYELMASGILACVACATAPASEIWASHIGGITRYNEDGSIIASLPFETLHDLAVSSDSVWGLGNNTIFRFDLAGNVMTSFPSPIVQQYQGGEEASMTFVDGTLWITQSNDNYIYRVNASTGAFLPGFQSLLRGVSDLLVAGNAVWVSYQPGGVSRFTFNGQSLGFATSDAGRADLALQGSHVLAVDRTRILHFELDGTVGDENQFGVGLSPNEIAMEAVGNTLWIADGRLLRFTPNGIQESWATDSETDLVLVPAPAAAGLAVCALGWCSRRRLRPAVCLPSKFD